MVCKVKTPLDNPATHGLETEELQSAEKYWIRQAQIERYSSELESLKRGENVSKHSLIQQLTPFLDQAALMRVGGRLKRAQLPYEAKHPIILPKRYQISRLIISHVHREMDIIAEELPYFTMTSHQNNLLF
jgi:hypothetical protein